MWNDHFFRRIIKWNHGCSRNRFCFYKIDKSIMIRILIFSWSCGIFTILKTVKICPVFNVKSRFIFGKFSCSMRGTTKFCFINSLYVSKIFCHSVSPFCSWINLIIKYMARNIIDNNQENQLIEYHINFT